MKNIKFLLIAVLGMALASCSMIGGGEQEPKFKLKDLQGYWLQNGDTTGHYVRFTDEKADETDYYYGYEWHEADWNDPDMTAEEFLLWNREDLGHPGNGWFKYKFVVTDGGLHEIHFMDNQGADIPKFDYVVTKLTDTELAYYEKDKKANKYTFSKVVAPKK